MRIEEAILAKLESEATVTALATGGIFQLIVPQHESRPSVAIQLIDQPKRAHLRGYIDLFVSRVQIDAYAQMTDATPDPYTAVADLAEAVDDVLGPESFTVGSPGVRVVLVLREDRRPFDPDEHRNYRMMQDYRIFHREL